MFSDVELESCLSYLIISESVTTILKNSFAAATLNHSQRPKESIDNVTIYHYSVQFLAFFFQKAHNISLLTLFLSAALLVSILNSVFTAFDIYVVLAYPLKYRSHNTSKYANNVTVAIWIFCFRFLGCSFIQHLLKLEHWVTNYYLQLVAISFEDNYFFFESIFDFLFVIL